MSDQPLTAEQMLQDIKAEITNSLSIESDLMAEVHHVRQIQQDFQTRPVFGRFTSLKKLIYALNNSTFSQQSNLNWALLRLIEALYQEFEEYRANENKKFLELESRLDSIILSGVSDTSESLMPPSEEVIDSEILPPVEPSHDLDREELVKSVQSFPHWYQRIYLGKGVYTYDKPAHHEVVWSRLRPIFPDNLQNASVLDVGCNAGYFSIQLKQLGAGRVVGIEAVSKYLKQAETCRRILGLDIEYVQLDAHQLKQIQEKFDIVVFTGIFYHLKNPLEVLEQVEEICNDVVLIETEVMLEQPGNSVHVRLGPLGQMQVVECKTGIMKFVENDELNGDVSNWWIPDTECVKGMLRTAGFKYFSPARYVMNNHRLIMAASKKSDSILDLHKIK